MTTTIPETSQEMADNYCATIVEELEETFNFWGYIEDALEVKVMGYWNSNAFQSTGVEVTVTIGGPNAFIVWNTGDWVQVEVYWGGSEASEQVHCPGLANVLAEYADAVAGE